MRTFDPVRAWQLIGEERITTGLLVPAMLNFMLQPVPPPSDVDIVEAALDHERRRARARRR